MDVPVEILYQIFQNLGPADLLRCGNVCSKWRTETTQPRLWASIDLSLLTPRELESLAALSRSLVDNWFVSTLNRSTSAVVLKCPSYVSPRHLGLLQGLLTHTHHLKTLHLDRIQLEPSTCELLFSSLAPEAPLETLSLRQTLLGSDPLRLLLQGYGSSLRHLDISYTSVDDLTLDDIAAYCPNLESLSMDAVFRVSATSLREFLVRTGPVSLTHLSFKYAYLLRPQWVAAFMSRQAAATAVATAVAKGLTVPPGQAPDSSRPGPDQGPGLQRLSIEGCDMFTLRDVKVLKTISHGECEIIHTAILEEDSLEGYRSLIDRLATGVVHDMNDSQIDWRIPAN